MHWRLHHVSWEVCPRYMIICDTMHCCISILNLFRQHVYISMCVFVCVQFLRCTMKENNYDTWMWNMNEHDPGLHQVLRHEARLEGHHSRRGRSLDNDVLSLNKLFVLLGGYYDEIKCAEVKTWNTPKPK